MLPEIQTLRALAVALVLIYHAWPTVVRGGFIGVDVFFAISGFLITSHLLREVDRSGRLSLGAFWVRRARRILPASMVVILAATIGTLVVMPDTYWDRFLAEGRASALYVQNWHLADAAVDYLATDDLASVFQHFWSLSIEEQFYLVWPVLIFATIRVAGPRRRALALTLGAITALSLAYSVSVTAANPKAAYFFTPARAWEFAAGGLLALAPAVGTTRPRLRLALCWIGILAILASSLVYTSATPFPGIAALLPVAAGLLVIGARASDPVVRSRPLQFLGDISYSVYLWHWPLLVLAPWALDRPLATADKAGILALTIVLAWGTKIVVEDPVRFSRRRFTPPRTLALAGAASSIILAVTLLGDVQLAERVEAAKRIERRALTTTAPCFGAGVRDPEHDCRAKARGVVPSPLRAPKLPNAPCTRIDRGNEPTICAFGASKRRAVETIALIGDSHASHWRAALAVVAREEQWRGLSITHTNCPLSAATPDLVQPFRRDCMDWRRRVLRYLRAHPEVRTVFVSQSVASPVIDPRQPDQLRARADGFARMWPALPASVKTIVVIRDIPKATHGGRTLACVARAVDAGRDPARVCSLPRSEVLRPDPAAIAARRMRSERVRVIDMTRWFCDRRVCHEVIGGVLVHKDVGHMTAVYGRTLGPYLGRAFHRVARGG